MILYELKCAADHRFEGWFRNSDAYDVQSSAGEVACPICGDSAIEKAPMAPHVARSSRGSEAGESADAKATDPKSQDGAVPAVSHADRPGDAAAAGPQALANLDPMQILRAIRRHVEANCAHVGPAFAEEARKMHYGETERRGIYGEATQGEAEALIDEGIEIAHIPWVPPTDS
jgi:hypothetical protein